MTSSHHAPYALGDTRATMAGTKGRDPARAATRLHEAGIASNRRRYLNRKGGDAEGRASDWSEVVTSPRVPPARRHGDVKRKERDGVSLAFGIAGPRRRPARRAISSVVERAPDNCVVVPGLRIDGAIQVRSNVDPTFYSLVGSGRSGGTTMAPLFSRIHTSLISVWTAISRAQTKNYEIAPFILGRRRDRTIRAFFFHAFPGGLEKAAINRIFLTLPSRKEEREILFPFRRDQEIGSSHKKNTWLINNSLLGLRPLSHYERPDQCNGMCLFIYLLTRNGSRRGNKHTWRAQYTGELYAAFGKDESLPKRNLLILSQLVGPSLVQVQDGPAAPKKRIEEASDSFIHAPLGSGDIAQLVELRSCNWVVAITGWMSNCPGGNDSILYLNRWLTFSKSSMDRTWTIVGVGGSPRVPSSGIPGEEDQELRDRPKDAFGIQGSRTDHRTLFNKWNALAVCSQLLSIVGLYGRISRGPRGGGLPCGGCQRFESAYLQLVSLVGTKLYDSTQFFRFGSSIYDLSFMDVDKILPFSSTLGWHSLKVKGEAPRDEEGRSKRRNASGVENKRRSGDSRIGQPFKLLPNPWAGKRQPGELKHLSNQRKRKQKRFP
uniref:Uncharacterized protein ycf68 n=1 Tax=Salix viminalis TaxID=40686 RepID=A0A6N2L1K4_SALVM